MKAIKDRRIIEDSWTLLPAGEPVPASGDVIVSVSQWNAAGPEITSHSGKLGVILRSSESPDEIQRRDELPLIAIDFPRFGDGRGYSSARMLRDRLGYRGELRAIGEVLRDQLFYMQRCGMDSFVLKPGKDVEGALSAFDEFSVTYQGAADDPRPLFRRVTR